LNYKSNIYPDVTHFNLYAQHEESQTSVEDRTLMTRPPSNILQNKQIIHLPITYIEKSKAEKGKQDSQPTKNQQQVRSSKQLRSKSITARTPPPKSLPGKKNPQRNPTKKHPRRPEQRVARCRSQDP